MCLLLGLGTNVQVSLAKSESNSSLIPPSHEVPSSRFLISLYDVGTLQLIDSAHNKISSIS